MAPKSSDGEMKDGSSSSYSELTEPMDTSSVIGLSVLGKRRAETPNPDDSGESEQTEGDGEEYGGDEDYDDVDFDEESYRDREDTEPEWGYDSFDDRKYDSSDNREYSDKEFEKKCRHYSRQLIETKGFFETTDEFPPYLYSGIGWLGDLEKPAMLGLTTRQVCEKLTSLCLQRYNEDEKKNVKMVQILRANFNPSSMTKFYITFSARESESLDAPLVEYQAKAVWSVEHKIYPILCRPSPPPKRAGQEGGSC